MIGAALLSSESEQWATPARVLRPFVAELGRIALDPCCAIHAHTSPEWRAGPLNARECWYADGLDQSWAAAVEGVGGGWVWVNPPYGRALAAWADACAEAAALGLEVVALVPARTDTAWWRTITRDRALVGFVAGRLPFEGPAGVRAGAPFPSALIYHGRRPQRFAAACARVPASVWAAV